MRSSFWGQKFLGGEVLVRSRRILLRFAYELPDANPIFPALPPSRFLSGMDDLVCMHHFLSYCMVFDCWHCIVWCAVGACTVKTHHINSNLNPVWNQFFEVSCLNSVLFVHFIDINYTRTKFKSVKCQVCSFS